MTPQEAIKKIHAELGVRTVIVADQLAHFATVQGPDDVAKQKYRINIFETGDTSLIGEYGATLEEAVDKAIAKARSAGMKHAA